MRYFHSFVIIAATFAAGTVMAAEAAGDTDVAMQKTAFAPTGAKTSVALGSGSGTLVFTAPPRESEEEGKEIYGPVAEYLSKAIGRKVEYRYPGTWGIYRTGMLKGDYDLIFDGPHFCSYRTEKLGHAVLVKIPATLEFSIIVRKDSKYTATQQLAGHQMCSHAPPNLGALVMLNQYDNPVRQPAIHPVKGWDEVYNGVQTGMCDGGVIPTVQLKKFDKKGEMRVLFQSSKIPNQAFSAGPRVSHEEQAKIAQALLAPEATGPTAKLRGAFKVGDHFVAANNQEYNGLAEYLRNEWGYY